MEKVLLDTNMFIYIEDYKVIEERVAKLTKRLFDSDRYSIVIHPMTKKEILKFKDERQKNIFLSKISVYKEIMSPPKATKDFHNIVGCNNSHDFVDNELLFSISRNCAKYLISNDKELIKKAEKIGLQDRVLSIDDALLVFDEPKEKEINSPPFIISKFLYELDINDSFFDSLRDDYEGFDRWFTTKQEQGAKAYITEDKGKIKSFLMLKVEDENEPQDNTFIKPFEKAKRIKVSTMKVVDNGKKIGESFIKIMMDVAKNEEVDEVFVTVFDKQQQLINMFEEYGFHFYTYKRTKKSNGEIELENVLVKKMKGKEEYYPFFSIKNKKVFLIPVQEKYHQLLFPEAEKVMQLNIFDHLGENIVSNSIKKAYLSNSKIAKIEKGSILLFYSSGCKKCITSLGIVDAIFKEFDNCKDLIDLVRKRTAYDENELKREFRNKKLVIMFKHYYSFEKPVSRNYLLENGIINGPIQSIMEIKDQKKFKMILDECKINKDFYIIDSI